MESDAVLTVAASSDSLWLTLPGADAAPMTLIPTSPASFRLDEREDLTINFEGRGGVIDRVVTLVRNSPQVWTRIPSGTGGAPPAPAAAAAPAPPPPSAAAPTVDTKPATRTAPRPWPGFRGDNAAGNGDGQGAVVEWDVDTQHNIRWKTRDSWHLQRQSCDLGQPCFRGDGRQQRRRQDLPHRAVWRRRAGDRSCPSTPGKSTASTRRREDPVGARRHQGRAEGKAPHERQPGELNAGHRRPARRRDVRVGRACSRRGT